MQLLLDKLIPSELGLEGEAESSKPHMPCTDVPYRALVLPTRVMELGFNYCEAVAPFFRTQECEWHSSLDSLGELHWSTVLALQLAPATPVQFFDTFHFYTDGSSFLGEGDKGAVDTIFGH